MTTAPQWISPKIKLSSKNVLALMLLLTAMMDANGEKELTPVLTQLLLVNHCSKLISAIQLPLPNRLPKMTGNSASTNNLLLIAPLKKDATGPLVKN
jgi:hypothetical protein